ncbi:MAG: LLM class F420-dependent oxidoreductase [Actinobacteria bacterium]|nr:LLM class F420-dependent oxidoreductase [Actinomycetota bacterium]
MEFGIGYYPTHDSLPPAEVARIAEQRGYTSLFFAEHTHIPVSCGDEVQRRISHLYELFVAIMSAVGATSRLRVGSGVCLVGVRDPIITAKQVASVDDLSGGRFEFGVGAGWIREEMRNHGTDPRTRMRLIGERVAAMKAIWAADEAAFAGDFVNFDPLWSWPKPVQRPHPPILVGGNGPKVVERVLEYGDAWMPNLLLDKAGGDDILGRAKEMWARAERPIDLFVVRAPADPAVLEQLRGGGCRRAIHWLQSGGRDQVEAALDAWDGAIAEFTGEA